MSEEKQHPALVALLGIVPGIVNTITSVIRDKKVKRPIGDPSNPIATVSVITDTLNSVQDIASGIKLSSKRMMNIAGTGIMISIAAKDYLANGLSWQVVALFAVGAIYSGVMAWITHRSEQ